MPKKTLQERALERLWELFKEGDWGNSLNVLEMYTTDVRSGRVDKVAGEVLAAARKPGR
jgi:hypothetical protein